MPASDDKSGDNAASGPGEGASSMSGNAASGPGEGADILSASLANNTSVTPANNTSAIPNIPENTVGRTMTLPVRIAAALVGVLMVTFFVVVIQATMTIPQQVEFVKSGPYPVSVAAGHIETNLIRLETAVEQMASSPLSMDPQFEEGYAKVFAEISEDMDRQMDVIDDSYLRTPEKARQLHNEFDLLASRLDGVLEMCWRDGQSTGVEFDSVRRYVYHNLLPLIQNLLELNDVALSDTTYEVNHMHETVNASLDNLLLISIAMMVSVVGMVILYVALQQRRNRFENELRSSLSKALAQTREANAAKSAFLSNMSHDIRTPMNAIVGLTTIAQENIDDTLRVSQCLTRIATSSQHLLSLINDVLDMNKIESGKVTLSQEVFSIDDLIDEIKMIAVSQPGAKKRNCVVVVEGSVRHHLLIGDSMRLRQVMLNLTSNALKYTNEGDSIDIIVRENPQPDPGHASLTMVVEDTGIGMKQEFVKHIFEPFERERNDFTIFTEGTGLGMAITKNLVDLMGGTISVDSELGIGTRVVITMTFPIADEESISRATGVGIGRARADAVLGTGVDGGAAGEPGEVDSNGVAGGSGAEAGSDGASGKKAGAGKCHVSGRVLVVEDNEINMEIAKQLISSRGAEVEEAVDGLDAVMKISDLPDGYYDLIFMDWQMPHMNGIEATKAIRKFFDEHGYRDVPIVAMTANAFDSDRVEALAAGMVDFMAKPINVRQLEAVLSTYLKPE